MFFFWTGRKFTFGHPFVEPVGNNMRKRLSGFFYTCKKVLHWPIFILRIQNKLFNIRRMNWISGIYISFRGTKIIRERTVDWMLNIILKIWRNKRKVIFE